MFNRFNRFLAFTVGVAISGMCLSTPSSFAAEPQAFPATPSATQPLHLAIGLDQEFADDAQEWENGLQTIMEIPDEVLIQGDEATQHWVRANLGKSVDAGSKITVSANVLGCTAAITKMIATNVVGAAKLLKIKKYIKALGGVKEAVKLMWRASFKYEKMKAVGGALGALASELSGVSSVRSQCFN